MYQKIMVPLDGSELAECVLPHVEAFIKDFPVATVALVKVLKPEALPVHGGAYAVSPAELEKRDQYRQRLDADKKGAAEDYLEKMKARLDSSGVEVRPEVLSGKVADSLKQYAEENQVDLIIIGTHGRSGVSRWVWGSTADRMLRSANIPILMIRDTKTK